MARERFRFAHALEGALAMAGFGLLRLLPLDWASGLSGFVARSIGPRLGISNRARQNLRRAMPNLSVAEIERVITGMWDNLGRVVAEYPHLGAFRVYEGTSRVEIVGAENIRAQGAAGKRAIFFYGCKMQANGFVKNERFGSAPSLTKPLASSKHRLG